jgi:hypothetical protein
MLRLVFPVAAFLFGGNAVAGPSSGNLIDRLVFEKLERDRIQPAPPAGDSEFLRRLYLDMTGRLPEVETVKSFLADTSADKRQKAIDALFPPLPVPGMRSISQAPFLDRWTYFFCDLFRNGQLLEEGINTFYDYIYKVLTLNLPYDEFVREMITASAVSTWDNGAANMIARSHVFEGDGYQINHEDTADEIAIATSKVFLGVNLECVSCHDGRGHLEKINLWLSERKRADLWRQASFFGKTFISPVFGRSPQFMVRDTAKGYDLTTVSSLRPRRNPKEDVTPTFILNQHHPAEGENERAAYARLITSNPQFARATVNLFWTELIGQGIVENPFDFDLARQDPKNPPPAPWTLQPSNPELLDALAAGFRAHGYDLRWLIRTIVSSRTYQLSSHYPGKWKPGYENDFARRSMRRLSAEQLWDAVSQVTEVFPNFQITYSPKKVHYILQTRSPQDLDKSSRPLYKIMQSFGQCDRYTAEADRRASMVQAAILMNDTEIRNRLKIQKGSRLEAVMKLGPDAAVDNLFLATLSRPPSAEEKRIAVEEIRSRGEEGAEDVLWVLFNRLDFLFY